MERHFLEPLLERLYAGCPDIANAKALREGKLPENVRVSEFFFVAGRCLAAETAQQNYISANYTQVGRYLIDRGQSAARVLTPSTACRAIPTSRSIFCRR